ncbi:MAG: DUF362 domain-containing protein [Lentisphaerales bacterium]|jgi:uncharacterized protein (DUF362 family)/Pyruvate/2-oxoacid:ferredoxin oxidoreductase delta subunit|nr:MAG: DUF362 domain-containing protein [Lentisphaerales bacterium]
MKTRVALVAADDYSRKTIGVALPRLLQHLGGLKSFVKSGQTVLLKPNLLTAREPEKAVTTHPELVRGLIRMVKELGGKPVVADSPANVMKIESVWEKTGFLAMCREEDVPLLCLEKEGSIPFTVDGFSFSVASPVLNADLVINLPKVKTHLLTILTGAVKNTYGTIPGFQKTGLHKSYPTPREFGRLLAALYSKVRPGLAIADGIVGMEGEGPSGGRPVKLGILAASVDGVALDTVLCRILGINAKNVHYLAESAKLGAGEARVDEIEVIGARVEDVAPPRFKAPSTLIGAVIPGGLVRVLRHYLWIRPSFSDKCIACGMCVRACPVQVLRIVGHTAALIQANKCIGCCCCHETCPEQAVEMQQSPVLRAIRGGRFP